MEKKHTIKQHIGTVIFFFVAASTSMWATTEVNIINALAIGLFAGVMSAIIESYRYRQASTKVKRGAQ